MDTIQNSHLAKYVEDCMRFVKTLVVKFNTAALLMNEKLVMNYGEAAVDKDNPYTWKYYLNLSGQYHPTDTIMTVVSNDTLEPIEFTAENLKIHTATARTYAYGTREYHNLVYRYPAQEMLINGILYPCDIVKAVEAEDGTILSYAPETIEASEETLILDLEKYIKATFYRWHNRAFVTSNTYDPANFFTILHNFVLPKLMNLRQQRCKTSEAHSFHIRMYLASHNGLDRYLPYMTRRQALWLYRNIRRIQRNFGKTSQFEKLVQKLLTERGIPLGDYSIRQLDKFDQAGFPEIVIRRKPLNDQTNMLTDEYLEIEQVYHKEQELTEGNPLYLAQFGDDIKIASKTTNSSVVQTKAMDSSMVDYSNAVPEPFEMVAMRQWCYMVTHGMYDVFVSFSDPKTSDTRTMTALDAFIYFQYIALMHEGIDIDQIPEYLNMQQRIHPKPTVADLLSVVPYKEKRYVKVAQTILARQPVIEPCFSVSSFNQQVQKLTDEAYWHWFLISATHDLDERAHVENMIRRLYSDVKTKLMPSPTRYVDWLASKNLPVYNYSVTEAKAMMKAIYEAVTGYRLDQTKQLKNIQKAMIGLLLELSSYSIQITREVNETDLTLINWPTIRPGNLRTSQEEYRHIDPEVLTLSSHGSGSQIVTTFDTSIPPAGVFDTSVTYVMSTQENLSPSMTPTVKLEQSVAMQLRPMEVEISYLGQNKELEAELRLPGYTTFNNLTESQRKQVKSIYD